MMNMLALFFIVNVFISGVFIACVFHCTQIFIWDLYQLFNNLISHLTVLCVSTSWVSIFSSPYCPRTPVSRCGTHATNRLLCPTWTMASNKMQWDHSQFFSLLKLLILVVFLYWNSFLNFTDYSLIVPFHLSSFLWDVLLSAVRRLLNIVISSPEHQR